MNTRGHALSLMDDHLQCACDYMGTCTQTGGGPALQGEGQRTANEAITHSFCVSVPHQKGMVLVPLSEIVMRIKRAQTCTAK